MPDLEVNVKVVGANEASDDLKQFGDSAKDAGDNIRTAGSNVQSTASSLSDFKTNLTGVAGSLTAVSSSVINIVSSFTRLEQAQIRVDTANRRVETSAISVTKAQEKYNDAVKKFGADSEQAQKALAQLKTAQEGHAIAVDRAEVAQSRLNETMASFGSEIATNVIGVFGSIVSAITTFTTKGEGGVSLAGKLKQSFLDLVSGGGNVKNTMDTAGNAIQGLGTKSGTAGSAAGGLKNEVLQLGSGLAQAVPNVGQFTGGITNTAVAAERSVGPLGNIERSVASTAAEVGGAVAPLGAFAGGMTTTGTAAEGVVGGLEAAAASTGALETGAVAATTETVALGAAVGTSTVALAAFTAGIGLAVAAIVAYVLNIGGFRDKTNEAIAAAQKFLAIGWESFAKKFEPVTKAIEGGVKALEDFIGKAGEAAKLDVSGQFKQQPSPGQALGPSGRPLDETIAAENPAVAKGTAGILNMVEAMKQLAEQRVRMEGLSKTGVANSNANAAAFNNEAQAVTKLVQPLQLITNESGRNAQAINQARDAMNQTISITQKAAQGADQYGQAIRSLTTTTQSFQQQQAQFSTTINSIDSNLAKLRGTIQANNAILQSSNEIQKLWETGWDQMTVKLQQAQEDLVTSQGALAKLDSELSRGQPQLTAYNQGWVDFNTKMDQAIISASKAQGEFDAFITTLGTGKQRLADFATGFTEGEKEIQKWATDIQQGTANLEGQQSALDTYAQKVGVQVPEAIRTSIARQQEWIEIIQKTPDALQKLADAADKVFQSVAQGWQKVFQSTSQQDFGKNLFENLQNQVQKFGTVLSPVTNTVGQFMAQMQTVMQQGISRTQAELASAVFAAPRLDMTNLTTSKQSLQRIMDDMNGVFARFGNTLPAATQQFKPLISAINEFGQHAKDPTQVQQAIGLMSLAMDAAFNPMDRVKQAMLDQGLAAVGLARNADGTLRPIQQVGQNSQTATDPTNKMASALQSMESQAKKLQDTITHLPDQISGLPVQIDKNFTSPWLQAIGKISSAIAGLIENISGQFSGAGNNQLAGIVGAIDKNFTQPFLTGIGKITSGVSGLVENINSQLANINDVNLDITANTGPATAAISTLVNQWIIPLEGQTVIQVTANTGPATAALSTLVNQWIIPLEGQTIIQVTANTGPAAAALSALVNQWIIPLEGQTVIPVTANTGPAASALQALMSQFVNPLKQPVTITPQANTGFAAQALQVLMQSYVNPLKQPITIQVTANTQAASNAIASLQRQLNALNQRAGVAQPGYYYAAKGGQYALGLNGFRPVKEEHAARGGSFIVTKQTRLANLTVGEGNKPELVTFAPSRKGGRSVGILSVVPLPKFKAAAGGVFGATPNLSSPPTMGGFLPQTGQPISYGAGLPAPGASTVGAGTRLGYLEAGPGVVQMGPPSSDPNQQAQPGPVTSPGPFFSPGTLPGGLSQTRQVSTSVMPNADVSPYSMAQMTGQAVADEISPTQEKIQSDMSNLLALVRKLIAKIMSQDINANLMIDGQKMASTVSKYIGSDAYGGR